VSLRKKSNPIEDSLIRKGKVGSGKTEETFSPSESLYRALFDSGPQSMVLIGPDGRIRAFNENAAREVQEMRGCFYEIGRPLTDYVGEKYVSVFNERFQKALQGEIIRLERTVTDRAGVERWFEFSYHPVFDEQKKIIGVCLASASIEGRKRAEEALRVSESNLKALFDSSSESLVFIGSDGRIQAFNKNAAAAGREVHVDGSLVELTRTEFDVLATLAARPRMVFSRRQLIDAVWGDDWYGDEHLVDVHIGHLRRKLGDDADAGRYVRTVRGVGYRMGDGQ